MIITIKDAIASKVFVYDRYGNVISRIMKIDTETMEGEVFMGVDRVTGELIIKRIPVYKIKGPGIYYTRKSKRVINSNEVS